MSEFVKYKPFLYLKRFNVDIRYHFSMTILNAIILYCKLRKEPNMKSWEKAALKTIMENTVKP